MKISIITLFPKMISGFFEESIVKRAVEKKLVEIEIINLRDFAIMIMDRLMTGRMEEERG